MASRLRRDGRTRRPANVTHPLRHLVLDFSRPAGDDAGAAMSDFMGNLDRAALHAINQWVGRVPAFDSAMIELVDLALLKGVVLMVAYAALWFAAAPRSLRRRQLLAGMMGIVATGVVARFLQHALPFHNRPLHTPDFAFHLVAGQNPDALNHWGSFPSDHAAFFGAIVVVLALQSRALGIGAFLWTLLVVCFPRLYLGYHWPSDLIGGLVLGALVAATVVRTMQSSVLVARLEAAELRRPALFYGTAFALVYQVATSFNELRRLAAGSGVLVRLAWAALGLPAGTG